MSDADKTEQEAWARVTDHFGCDETTIDERTTSLLRDGPEQTSIVLARYKFLARLTTPGHRVLEIGVTQALGSRILAEFASSFVGIDSERTFVNEANGLFERFGMRFQTEVADEAESYDVIVCLDLAQARRIALFDGALSIDEFLVRAARCLSDRGIVAFGLDDGDASKLSEARAAFERQFAQVFSFSCRGESIVADRDLTGEYTLLLGLLPQRDAADSRASIGLVVADAAVDAEGSAPFLFGPHLTHWLRRSPRRLLHSMSYYRFCSELIGPNRKVLDVGCGEGLGTWLLAKRSGTALGIDLDGRAIDTARRNFRDSRIRFEFGDFFELPAEPFDAVVNFDCIEHIFPHNIERFWRKISAHLSPVGMAIIGTPSITSDAYANPATRAGHVNLYSGDRLEKEMSQHFRNVLLFSANDETVHTGFRPLAHYYIAIGTGPLP